MEVKVIIFCLCLVSGRFLNYLYLIFNLWCNWFLSYLSHTKNYDACNLIKKNMVLFKCSINLLQEDNPQITPPPSPSIQHILVSITWLMLINSKLHKRSIFLHKLSKYETTDRVLCTSILRVFVVGP